MPEIKQLTLIDFENSRKTLGYLPAANQEEVFQVGNGVIIIKNNPKDMGTGELFSNTELDLQSRTINSGYGEFLVRGAIINITDAYYSVYVNSGVMFNIQDRFKMSSESPVVATYKKPPVMNIDGTVNLLTGSIFTIKEGVATFSKKSSLKIAQGSQLLVDVPSTDTDYHVYIHGELEVDFNVVGQILHHKNIFIADDVHIQVTNLPSDRYMSMTDIVTELNKRYQNVNTVGVKNPSNTSRVTYRWMAGNPKTENDVLSLSLDYGECYLGDFDLLLQGMPINLKPKMQIISTLTIQKRATLKIFQELENGMKYVLPTLHITRILGNSLSPGVCNIFGQIIVDGNQSSIEFDRECQLIIEKDATLTLQNKGFVYNLVDSTAPVLIIKGTLIIDSFENFKNIKPENIVLEETGKIVILNTCDPNMRKIIFSTPDGIMDSDLYKYFGDRLHQIEYHIPSYAGIKIDRYFEYYAYMEWYNHLKEPMTIMRAIKEGYIIWHENAFIEIDHDIVDFVNENSTLMVIGQFFNSYGSDQERTQQVAYKFSHTGAENIMFRFVNGNNVREIILDLDACRMIRALYNRVGNKYRVYTDGPGTLYLKNNIDKVNYQTIMIPAAKRVEIDSTKQVEFQMP